MLGGGYKSRVAFIGVSTVVDIPLKNSEVWKAYLPTWEVLQIINLFHTIQTNKKQVDNVSLLKWLLDFGSMIYNSLYLEKVQKLENFK